MEYRTSSLEELGRLMKIIEYCRRNNNNYKDPNRNKQIILESYIGFFDQLITINKRGIGINTRRGRYFSFYSGKGLPLRIWIYVPYEPKNWIFRFEFQLGGRLAKGEIGSQQ